jgi:hypothetical protein
MHMGNYFGMSESSARFLAGKLPESTIALIGKKSILGDKNLILREFAVSTPRADSVLVIRAFVEVIQAKPWFKDGHIFTHLAEIQTGTLIGEWTDEEMATVIGTVNGNVKTGKVEGAAPGPP